MLYLLTYYISALPRRRWGICSVLLYVLQVSSMLYAMLYIKFKSVIT